MSEFMPLGPNLCLGQRREISSVLSILADLVVIPRIHTDDHAISWFEMLEGEFECLPDRVLMIAHPTRCQDLKAQARLVNIPDYFGHVERVGGEERIADLNRDYRRHFFQFLRRSGNIVEASHEQIDLPAFVGDFFDAIGIMGRNAGQHAGILDAFHKIVDLPAFAFSEQSVGDTAVMYDCDGPSILNNLFD